jgi:glycosyltransferase involved in cell wall biosynthesis
MRSCPPRIPNPPPPISQETRFPFSVLILALNEERDLPGCLASVSGCEDVVVLDSGSTDATAAIARATGARVFERRFDNFAGQRNFAHREIPFRHRWVFHLDADERMTPELAAECAGAAGRRDVDGFYAAPKMMFEGRWIPRCTDYPAWQARFARLPVFEFVEVGHGQREAPGLRMGRLRAGYWHDLSSGGEAEWTEKHRRYAAAEAREQAAAGRRAGWRDLLAHDALARRRAAKSLSYLLPCRPALRFVYQYFLKRGFLDGGPGYRYCLLLARYESYTAEEMRRLRPNP